MKAISKLAAAAILCTAAGCADSTDTDTAGHSEPSSTEGTMTTTYKPPVSEADVEREVGEATQTVKQYAAQKKDEYAAEIREKMRDLDARMDQLRARSDDLSEDARAKWNEKMKVLEQKQEVAREKLDKLKDSSGDAWKEMQSGFRSAWEDVQKAFDDASSEFKSKDGSDSQQ